MKYGTKMKLNNAKAYVNKHKGDIIAFCATSAVAVVVGHVCGTIIGKYINITANEAYKCGWQKGMSDYHDRMLRDNMSNPEVVKALVEFQDNHTK
ncbi:hypothetical protein [Agathobacter sp.]|uniref:hypothetical protein n=1 Tax=Agathobacter sp. TaxID=2021311 RepID=UPI003AB6EFE8